MSEKTGKFKRKSGFRSVNGGQTVDTLWNRVRKNLVDWYETAYDKTDELARIGKKKVEMVGVNRAIEKHLSELGGRIFDLIAVQGHKGNKTADDEMVQKLVSEVRELESELKLKEEEIEKIRAEKKEERPEAEGE
jgi:hypothetical protein